MTRDIHLYPQKEESGFFSRRWKNWIEKEYIRVYREESADTKDIFNGFTRYKDRVAIFHFHGGHANGSHLRFEEGWGQPRHSTALGRAENPLSWLSSMAALPSGSQNTFDAGVKGSNRTLRQDRMEGGVLCPAVLRSVARISARSAGLWFSSYLYLQTTTAAA